MLAKDAHILAQESLWENNVIIPIKAAALRGETKAVILIPNWAWIDYEFRDALVRNGYQILESNKDYHTISWAFDRN